MKTYLSMMLIYWLIADGDITFMNFHRTTTFRTTRRAIDYYMQWRIQGGGGSGGQDPPPPEISGKSSCTWKNNLYLLKTSDK